jgi:hypothetical protein
MRARTVTQARLIPFVQEPGTTVWRVLRDHFLENPAAVLRMAREVGPIEIIDRRGTVRAVLSVPGAR